MPPRLDPSYATSKRLDTPFDIAKIDSVGGEFARLTRPDAAGNPTHRDQGRRNPLVGDSRREADHERNYRRQYTDKNEATLSLYQRDRSSVNEAFTRPGDLVVDGLRELDLQAFRSLVSP